MKFRTEISVARSTLSITHATRIAAVGSCFSDEVSARLLNLKYKVCANPFGVMYNPLSIARLVCRAVSGKHYTVDELTTDGERWFSTDAHGSLSSLTTEGALTSLNTALDVAHRAFTEADVVIITLGTNWVYARRGEVVANCHKLPSAEFTRRAMSVEEVCRTLSDLFGGVLKGKHIILTVSPVRHIKDGLAESSLSKAVLRVAAAQVAAEFADVDYFPSYEILCDDLRDYRFYAADMVHPSEQAVDYIWSKFAESYFDKTETELNALISQITEAASHRPFDAASPSYIAFCRNFAERAAKLCATHPDVNLNEEYAYFKSNS